MNALMMEFRDTVSDVRGTFRAWAMAGECGDGRWEGWLEFVLTDRDTAAMYMTPIETRQHDRATIAQWASGLSHVYAEGALARATRQQGLRWRNWSGPLDRQIPRPRGSEKPRSRPMSVHERP